jgi:hypothetical protein
MIKKSGKCTAPNRPLGDTRALQTHWQKFQAKKGKLLKF